MQDQYDNIKPVESDPLRYIGIRASDSAEYDIKGVKVTGGFIAKRIGRKTGLTLAGDVFTGNNLRSISIRLSQM